MKQRSRTEYSALNILTGIGGYVVNTVVGLVCRMVFVRCLSTEYLGVNGLFSNILSVLSLAELGVGGAIGYALYRPLAEHDTKKVAALMQFYKKAYMIIGTVIGAAGLALFPFINRIIGKAPEISENLGVIYLLFLFNTVISYFFSYRGALLQTAQQSYIVVGLSYVQTTLQSLFQITYLLLTHRYYGYLIIQTVGNVLYNILISMIARKRYPFILEKTEHLNAAEKKSISRNVRDLMISKVSGILVNHTDNIIITFFNGLTATGLTSNYTLFTGTLTALLNQVFNGMTASIGNHNVLSSDDDQEKMFLSINFLNFWLYGWAAVGIVCVSTDLVRLLYGDKYAMNILIPIALAINTYMLGMQNAVWAYKSTLGIFRHGRFVNFFTALLNIILSLVMGKYWGVFGVLFASAVSRAFTNTWYSPYCVYKYGFHKSAFSYFKRYIKYLLICVCCCVASFYLCIYISLPIILSVLVKCVILSCLFNGVVFLFFHKSREFAVIRDKGMIMIKKILKKWRPEEI